MVTQRAGQAAIERAEVRLPKALALDPDNAQALCEFEDGTKPEPTCPKGSIVGRASAVSPLLKRPLSGPVYFVKNVKRGPTGNLIRTLPMIVVALRGEIAINLIGESNVRGGRIVNTFARLPDASLSRFDLRLEGGGGGILVVTRTRKGLLSLCSPQTAKVAIRGQNGRRDARVIRVKTPCSGKRGQRRRGGGFDRFQGRRSAG